MSYLFLSCTEKFLFDWLMNSPTLSQVKTDFIPSIYDLAVSKLSNGSSLLCISSNLGKELVSLMFFIKTSRLKMYLNSYFDQCKF